MFVMSLPFEGFDLDAFMEMGFRPALSVKGTPTLVKRLAAGIQVGYGCTYTCETDEWIATFPIGYADGLWRELGEGKSYIIRDKTGLVPCTTESSLCVYLRLLYLLHRLDVT